METPVKIKLFRGGLDPRCDALVLNPIEHACKKYGLPMGLTLPQYNVAISYRFALRPKPIANTFHGVYIDDTPEAYFYPHLLDRFYEVVKSYDFYVYSNHRMKRFLQKKLGTDKPYIYYPGISGKDYYESESLLYPKSPHTDKRMALLTHVYEFNVQDFVRDGWTLLYFSAKDKNIPGTIWAPYTSIDGYWKKVSEFSPNVIVHGWYKDENYFYKTDLKKRDAVVLNSCLVAQDTGNIYNIKDGVDGYNWSTHEELTKILQETPLEKFNEIGINHKNTDGAILHHFIKEIQQEFNKW